MFLRKLVAFLALAAMLTAVRAHAQGMVQVTLAGEINTTGGARVEFDVTVPGADGTTATIPLSWFLAERTTAADLAVLLENRLGARGVRTVNTSEGQAARPVTCLFFEEVLGISMRLASGLRATVTLTEDRPASVRLLPPMDAKYDAELLTTVSTWIPHERVFKRHDLESRLEAAWPVVRITDTLVSQATRSQWDSEIEAHETWLPSATLAGGTIAAVNFDLRTNGDWRLEIALARRVQQR